MNGQDTRNWITAIVLSALVLFGWNYFFAPPAVKPSAQTSDASAPASPGGAPLPGASAQPPAANAAPAATREEALAASKRVTIDTPALSGSINLTGGMIDDLTLNNYRETVDPTSPKIVLLSPASSPEPYWAETGFVATDASVKTPNRASVWSADSDKLAADGKVTLSFDNAAGLVFKREISVDPKYMFTIKDWVEAQPGTKADLRPYALVTRHGKPKLAGYSALHEGFVGVIGDLGSDNETYSAIDKAANRTIAKSGQGGWIGITDKYWAAVVIPDDKAQLDARYSATGDVAAPDYQADVLGAPIAVDGAASAPVVTHVFAGAKQFALINQYQASLNIKLFDHLIDWGWFYYITKPLFRFMDYIYGLVGNFGIAIMVVTVVIKALFFPLANRSYQSMAKMKMIQPEIAKLKEQFPNDQQAQQQAQMALFKREGVNPVAGCLPMVIQIPVFFALYKVILVTIEMRQAPFFGWIHDLSSPDPTNVFNLFGLVPFDPTQIPVVGHWLYLGAWPIFMGISMFLQMKMNPEPADPVQKAMFSYMPLIFTFTLANFPVGLVIYWTWNNSLSIIQQYLILKRAGGKFELFDNLRKMLGLGTAA